MAWIQLPQGDLINADNIATVLPPTGAAPTLTVRTNDGTNLNYVFKSAAEAQEAYLAIIGAVTPTTLSLSISSITPNTAPAAANFVSVVVGTGFEVGGGVALGGGGLIVTFINSTTLMVAGSAPSFPAVDDVTYTAPDLVRTAVLTGGFTTT